MDMLTFSQTSKQIINPIEVIRFNWGNKSPFYLEYTETPPEWDYNAKSAKSIGERGIFGVSIALFERNNINVYFTQTLTLFLKDNKLEEYRIILLHVDKNDILNDDEYELEFISCNIIKIMNIHQFLDYLIEKHSTTVGFVTQVIELAEKAEAQKGVSLYQYWLCEFELSKLYINEFINHYRHNTPSI